MLQRVVSEGLLKARGVVAIFPAHREGDDVTVLSENGSEKLATLHGLRQQVSK